MMWLVACVVLMVHSWAPGKSGFQLSLGGGGGGGVNRPPFQTGGGFEKRAQLTGPLISYNELCRQRRPKSFLSIENRLFFFHQIHGK